MKLYSASVPTFKSDVINNLMDEQLATAFKQHYGYNVGEGERRSWINSLNFFNNSLTKFLLDMKFPIKQKE